MNSGMNYFRYLLLGCFVFAGAFLRAEKKESPSFSSEELRMVTQQLEDMALQKKEAVWGCFRNMVLLAFLGGAFEGKLTLAAFKEAWAQKNIGYFVRVLCAGGCFAHEAVSAGQNLSDAYQFDSAKKDLEAQMRKQYSKPFDEQQFDLVDERDVREEAAGSQAAAAQ